MAYDLEFSIALGASKTGLTLVAQLVDGAGADVGIPITTGFVEIGNGYYLWVGAIPDDHTGGVKFYESGVPGTILTFSSINSSFNELLVEDYPAVGEIPTYRQMLWMLYSGTLTRDLVGTTLKFLKQNGEVAATFNLTLNSGNYPIKMVRLS